MASLLEEGIPMKSKKPQVNWWIALVLFSGFLISFYLDLTGPELHQWLGVGLGALAAYHLLVHWNWVEAVTRRFFGHTSREARVFYAVDACVMLGFLSILVSGLIISSWLSLPLADYATWRDVHVIASIATMLLVVLKIGVHWKWIVNTARRSVFGPAAPERSGSPAQPAASAALSRRDFVRLMGLAGVGAVFAVSRAAAGLQVLQAGASGLDEVTQVTDVDGSTGTSSGTSGDTSSGTTGGASGDATGGTSGSDSTGTCAVRCNRGCSYPGHCRRYTDSNGNGKCDFGECV